MKAAARPSGHTNFNGKALKNWSLCLMVEPWLRATAIRRAALSFSICAVLLVGTVAVLVGTAAALLA
jgi:hypothetical protein